MAKKEASLTTVRVVGQPVCEDGVHYAKGITFETTAERAAALGDLVEIVTATAAPKGEG